MDELMALARRSTWQYYWKDGRYFRFQRLNPITVETEVFVAGRWQML